MIRSSKHIVCSDGHKEKLVVLEPGQGQPGYGRKDRTGLYWVHGGGYREGFAELPRFIGRPKACVCKYGTVVVSPAYRLSIEAPFPAAITGVTDSDALDKAMKTLFEQKLTRFDGMRGIIYIVVDSDYRSVGAFWSDDPSPSNLIGSQMTDYCVVSTGYYCCSYPVRFTRPGVSALTNLKSITD